MTAGIPVISQLVSSAGGTAPNPTHDDAYGLGGYKVFATLAARDAHPAQRLKVGMRCYVAATDTDYRLADLTPTWLAITSGLGGTEPVSAVYTTTTANFVQPSPGAKVTVALGTTTLLAAGQSAFVAGGGYYSIDSVTDGTHVVLENRSDASNTPAGSTIVSGASLTVTTYDGLPVNVVACAQTAWTVDPVNGDDGAAGTSLAPVKRLRQILQRWQNGTVKTGGTIFITILSDLLSDDFFNDIGYAVDQTGATTILFVGTPTTTRSGTFDTLAQVAVPTAGGGGTPWSVADSAVSDWTPDARQIGQITSGADNGAWFVVDKHLGATGGGGTHQARITRPGTISTGGFTWTSKSVALNETYNIVKFPVFRFGVFASASVQGLAASPFIFKFLNPVGNFGFNAPAANIQFSVCKLDGIVDATGDDIVGVNFVGCSLNGLEANGLITATSCLVKLGCFVSWGSRLRLSADTYFSSCPITVRAGGILEYSSPNAGGAAACWDASGDAITVENGGILLDRLVSISSSAVLYGNGNGGVGVRLQAGAKLGYSAATPPNITGTGGDYAAPNVPRYFDAAATAGDIQWKTPTNPTPQSWANLVAAQPGGYGGNAVDPISGVQLLKVA